MTLYLIYSKLGVLDKYDKMMYSAWLLWQKNARVKKDDTLFDDTSVDTFDNTFGDTFNDLASFNYPLRTLLIASGCC